MLGPYNIEALSISREKIILGCSGGKAKLLRDKLSNQLKERNIHLAQCLAGCQGCVPRIQNNMGMPEKFAVSTREDKAELTIYGCAVLNLILSPGGIELEAEPPCITERTVKA